MTNRNEKLFCEEYAKIDNFALQIKQCIISNQKAVLVEYGKLIAPLFPNRRTSYTEHLEYRRARNYLKQDIIDSLPDNAISWTAMDNANFAGNWVWIFNAEFITGGAIWF